MKSIMMSIRPKYVSMILNGIKKREVRAKFPKDFVGWVYIYCTKEDDLFKSYIRMGYFTTRSTADDIEYNGKGKVVARFWCDKVEEINNSCVSFDSFDGDYGIFEMSTETLSEKQLLAKSCLTWDELKEYLPEFREGKVGYAIRISNLEIFDKPKEISDFHKVVNIKKCDTRYCDDLYSCLICEKSKLNKAPMSWCYVEGLL